jgi:hypothetical protein
VGLGLGWDRVLPNSSKTCFSPQLPHHKASDSAVGNISMILCLPYEFALEFDLLVMIYG